MTMTTCTCTCAGPTTACMKLHLLSHIVPCVRNWGPVWVYSYFQFESQNHSIKKLFHGSKNTSSTVSQIHTCTCNLLALPLGPLLTWLHAGTKHRWPAPPPNFQNIGGIAPKILAYLHRNLAKVTSIYDRSWMDTPKYSQKLPRITSRIDHCASFPPFLCLKLQ